MQGLLHDEEGETFRVSSEQPSQGLPTSRDQHSLNRTPYRKPSGFGCGGP